jgi:hypothetical protein
MARKMLCRVSGILWGARELARGMLCLKVRESTREKPRKTKSNEYPTSQKQNQR